MNKRTELEAACMALRNLHALTSTYATEGTTPVWEVVAEWHEQIGYVRERVEHLLSLIPEPEVHAA